MLRDRESFRLIYKEFREGVKKRKVKEMTTCLGFKERQNKAWEGLIIRKDVFNLLSRLRMTKFISRNGIHIRKDSSPNTQESFQHLLTISTKTSNRKTIYSNNYQLNSSGNKSIILSINSKIYQNLLSAGIQPNQSNNRKKCHILGFTRRAC